MKGRFRAVSNIQDGVFVKMFNLASISYYEYALESESVHKVLNMLDYTLEQCSIIA